MALVSVVVPVYNVEKYLDRCIDSIVNQTLTDIEIIVVNDGSPDSSPAMCDEWAKKDNRIKVIHQENGGLAVARNTGIKQATSKYIGFVDSDDWVELNMFETLYDEMIKNKADMVQCGINRVFGQEILLDNTLRFEIDKEQIKKEILPKLFENKIEDLKIYPARWNKLYIKDKLLDSIKICPEDLQNGEDYLLTTAYLFLCNKVVSIDTGGFYNYRYNDNSLTTIYSFRYRQSISRFFNGLENIAKHFNYSVEDMGKVKDFSYSNAMIFLLSSNLTIKEKIKEIKILRNCVGNKDNIREFSKTVNIKQKVILQLIYFKIYVFTVVALDFLIKIKNEV